jgi:DNA-directed RNA polymerase subunit RPC12/RpoP
MESYKCKECGKQFANPTNLKLHVKTVHLKEFRFSCEICGMGFTHMSHKRIHMRGHTGERPYKCEICGESFRYKDRLRIHLRGHTGERPFVCDVCKKGFASRSKLKRHEKIHEKSGFGGNKSSQEEVEPPRPLRYGCEDCGKAFAEPQHLSGKEKHKIIFDQCILFILFILAHKRYCQRKNLPDKEEKLPKATKSAPGKIKATSIAAVTAATNSQPNITIVTTTPTSAAAPSATATVQKIQIEHIPIQGQQTQMLVPVTYTYPVAYGYEVTTQQYHQQQTQQQQQQSPTTNVIVREYPNYN